MRSTISIATDMLPVEFPADTEAEVEQVAAYFRAVDTPLTGRPVATMSTWYGGGETVVDLEIERTGDDTDTGTEWALVIAGPDLATFGEVIATWDTAS